MKKFIYCATALVAALFAASCQREMHEPVAEGGVTYTITLPETVQTRGESGYAEYDLYYEVYKTIDAAELKTAQILFEKKVEMTGNTTTLTLDLLNDQDYTVLFWANKKGESYFNVADLRNVEMVQAASNNNDRDAFCGVDQIAQHDGAKSKTVTLTRPFAQLNIATIVSTTAGYDLTPINSYVKVSKIPVAYNVATASPVGEDAVVEYTKNTVPAGKKVNDKYDLVAMNYVLVPEGNIEVYYEIETVNGTVKNTVNNVPLKKNYRTNIIGNLLTSNATYTVEIKPGFETDGKEDTEVINEGVVKNINGDYEVSNAAGLAYAMKNLFVDANGVANTATFYIYPGTYDLTDYNVTYPSVSSGTLRVIKGKPVVTRTAGADDVIIFGLKDAFIKTVSEDATVIISGITIKDFEGTGAALVAENKGKVVLSDCEIINEDGTADVDTPLVEGNDPENVVGDDSDSYLVYTAEQLAAAFADNEVKSIGLGADIAVENTLVFPADRKATLDLRGWNLTIADPDPDMVANTYAINNLGDLTIKDSYGIGAVTARGIYNGYDAEGNHSATAKLTVESGIFNAMGTNGGAAVYNYGVADINGGKFESNGGYGLNNQGTGEMTIDNADVRGGVYNVGTLTVDDSKVYQHLSGKHCIYNWEGSVTINGGEFDSESGNELILADGENASVTINDGTFHKTAKSWLYGAATGKNITFTITGGTHYGYVNQPEMTVDTFRPYGDPIVVTGGSYNFDVTNWCHEDYKAVKNSETSMWDSVAKDYVAQVGEDGYESLNEAVAAAQEGETIILIKNIEQADGVIITDKKLTIDLNDKTFTVSEGANTNNRNFKIDGSSIVTIKNGTMVAAGDYSSGAYGTVRTEGTANVTLTNVKLYNYRGNGLNVKALSGTTVTISNTEVYSVYGGGIEAAGGAIELTDVTVEQEGMYTAPYNSMAISVNGGGTVTVNSGTYSTECITAEEANNQGTSHGPWCAGVLNSGGTLIISGGTFSNDNFGENSLATYARGAILADTGANIQINGGTFDALKNVIDIQNNLGDASKNPKVILAGGNFSSDPCTYEGLISVVEGYVVAAPETVGGYYTIKEYRPVAKVGNTEYGSIDEAIAAWTNNTTLTLLDDVTLSDVVTIKSTEHHILDLGTYTLTAASGQNAFVIKACGTGSAERYAITIKADATNPGGINAGNKSIIYYKYADGEISTEDRPIIKIEGGVFTGSTSAWGTAGIYTIGTAARKCATLNISGGEFHCTINGSSKSKLIITGGLFHYSVGSQGDSTAIRLISGGTFKTLGFMTADDNNTKFWFGTSMGNSNVGLYINDDNYLVVGGPVITEFDSRFQAKATNPTKWSSYLEYSSAAANGLYYTNAEMAIKKHGEANVVLP